MKVANILNIVLAVALVVVCLRLAMNGSKESDSSAEKAVLDNIATRTSIRSYLDKKVEKEKIQQLLKAGMAAPTAKNKQPWHFVVVTDGQLLADLGGTLHNARMASGAPLAIVVCGNLNKALDGNGREFWVQDASAATENILLAAHAMGLGAVWTGMYPEPERVSVMKKLLKLPDNLIPLNAIIIGYPGEKVAPKNKFKEENISYNVYKGGETIETEAEVNNGGELKPFDITSNFNENAFQFFTGDGLLLCSGNKQKSNAMTIGWGALGTLWQKPALTVYVAQGRYTHGFMEKSPYFTVMTFKDKSILKYMGTHTGRDGDKAAHLGLHTLYTKNGTPYYKEADMVIECRTMYGRAFDPKGFRDDVPREFYKHADAGLHSMYTGEVVSAMKR